MGQHQKSKGLARVEKVIRKEFLAMCKTVFARVKRNLGLEPVYV
jgi:hypothetical protein